MTDSNQLLQAIVEGAQEKKGKQVLVQEEKENAEGRKGEGYT